MATIQTGIELQDRFSGVIFDFTNGMANAVNSATDFQNAMNQNVNTTGLDNIQSELQTVLSDMDKLSRASDTQISPTVDMDAQVVQQFNNQIEQTKNCLERVQSAQQTINSASKSVEVLPDDARGKIEDVNERLLQMKEAMNQVTQNPFDLPTEAVEAELASLQNRIKETAQDQLNLNETLSNMNIENEQPPPVEIPVVWQTEPLDVFTGSGIDRFQQEVRSANTMMERLSNTQREIAGRASTSNVLPPTAAQDMSTLATRIDNVKKRIRQIENNPINMGTERANTELESLRSQLSQAIQRQNELNSAIGRMDIQSANTAYSQLSQTIGRTEAYIRDNVSEQGAFNETINTGTKCASELSGTIKRIAGIYAGIKSVGKVLDVSDELSQATARIDLMNDGAQTTQELTDKIFSAAQSAKGSYSDMAAVVAKFGNNAGDAFSSSEEVVDFAELVQKQMTIAGASASEASNAMLQLSQALGSGTLRGDELNSIFEQAPNLIQSIADYLNVPIGSIREMASEGELSADTVKNAMFAASDEINEKIKNMPITWGQVWTSISNSALKAFEPVLQKLSDIANSDAFQRLMDNASTVLSGLADAAMEVFSFISDNWPAVATIIFGAATAMLAYKTATLVAAAAQWIMNIAMAANPVGIIVAAFMVLISLLVAVAHCVAKTGGTASTTFGVITGWISVVIANIINMYKLIVNINTGIKNAVSALFYDIKITFTNTGRELQSFWYNLLSTVLTIIGNICLALNELPFIEFDYSGVVSAANDYAAKAREANGHVEDYKSVSSAFSDGMSTYDDVYSKGWVSNAYNKGAAIGDKISNKISDLVSGTNSTVSEAKEAADKISKSVNKANQANNTATAKNSAATAKNTGDTAKAAQDVAKSSDITGENLKYIKDLAEREYVNRFTTAKINVKQTNHNTVKNNMDLDGINEYLRSDLEQRMAATAEGTY